MKKERFIKPPVRDKFGAIVISNEELETLCYKQLNDFDQECFSNPKALDTGKFVENYLGFDVSFYTLHDKSIHGFTARKPGKFKILNDGKIEKRVAKKGDIVINEDPSINKERKNSSSMHEAKHGQTDLDVADCVFEESDGSFLINRSDNREKLSNILDIIERQADVYATFMLLPAPAVKMVFVKFFRLLTSRVSSLLYKDIVGLVKNMAAFFEVSKMMMAIRIEELKLLKDENLIALINYKRRLQM